MENYNPTITELRDAWEVAYGQYGTYALAGAMFVYLDQAVIEKLYRQALEDVREDLKEKGLV